MPDLAMCTDRACPKAQECYRFKAVANVYRQSYQKFVREPLCSSFIPLRDEPTKGNNYD